MEEEFQVNPSDDSGDESITDEESNSREEDREEDPWLKMEEQEFNIEVETAMQEGDEERLKFLFNIKEKRCSLLQEELNKSEKEEKAKRKRMREWEEKFKKLNKTETSLNKSLASSRGNTPASSPRKGKPEVKTGGGSSRGGRSRTVSTKKRITGKGSPTGKSFKPRSGFDHTSSREKRGEAEFLLDPKETNKSNSSGQELLNSILDLKQGKCEAFSEILNKVMEATNNIQVVNKEIQNNNGREAVNFKHVEVTGKTTSNNDYKTGGAIAEHNDVLQPEGRQQLIEMLNEFKEVKNDRQKKTTTDDREGKLLDMISKLSEKIEKLERQADEGKLQNNNKDNKDKKLQSGKTTKPDEAGIKKQVKFAHEKLNPKHVKDRIFDNLSFHHLVAGSEE